jgi:hypothetical protein
MRHPMPSIVPPPKTSSCVDHRRADRNGLPRHRQRPPFVLLCPVAASGIGELELGFLPVARGGDAGAEEMFFFSGATNLSPLVLEWQSTVTINLRIFLYQHS